MQGKTENIRHCFKINKKIFPLFITENIIIIFRILKRIVQQHFWWKYSGGEGVSV